MATGDPGYFAASDAGAYHIYRTDDLTKEVMSLPRMQGFVSPLLMHARSRRIVVVTGHVMHVYDYDGKAQAQYELPEPNDRGTALAANPDGRRLLLGTIMGRSYVVTLPE